MNWDFCLIEKRVVWIFLNFKSTGFMHSKSPILNGVFFLVNFEYFVKSSVKLCQISVCKLYSISNIECEYCIFIMISHANNMLCILLDFGLLCNYLAD